MKAVYAGTFDPVTFGHLDVVGRALGLFEELIVLVAKNPRKEPLFSAEERVELLEKALAGKKNVKVEAFDGLLVDYLKEKGLKFVVRGLREMIDFGNEFQQAITNKKLNPEIETIFLMTSPKYFYLNSTLVKEVVKFGGPAGEFVPKEVEEALKNKMK